LRPDPAFNESLHDRPCYDLDDEKVRRLLALSPPGPKEGVGLPLISWHSSIVKIYSFAITFTHLQGHHVHKS
jgi:hypothetical protein